MHEAGIAEAIAGELSTMTGVRSVRILVHDGHDDPVAFDDALRAHLAVALGRSPGGEVTFEIVHVPALRLCAACGATFEAPGATDPCPRCDGEALPSGRHERIELDLGPTATRSVEER